MSTDTLVFVFDLLGAMPQHGARHRAPPCPTSPGPGLPQVAEGSHGAGGQHPGHGHARPASWSGGC